MATKARYLKKFWISWATPHVDYNPGELRDLTRGDVVLGVNKRIQAFSPMTDFITARLRREKRLLSPEVTHVHIQISNVESLDFALYPRGKQEPYGMYSTYWMNPLDLLDLPDDKETFGNLGIKIVEEFLKGMAYVEYAVGEFPFDIFESAIADFRKNEMKVSYRPYKCGVEGTSLTSVFMVEDTPGEAVICIAFKKGRTELFRKKIATKRAGLGAYAFGFYPDVIAAVDAIEIRGVELSGVIRIPYSDLPSQLIDHIPLEAKKS